MMGKWTSRTPATQGTVPDVPHYDLIVIGAGSGNSVLSSEMSELNVAIVEPSRFGGTCLNRGCIPSKMFVVAANAARTIQDSSVLGVHGQFESVDWLAVRDRIFGRIDPLHQQAVDYRRENGIDVYEVPARFVGPRELKVGDETISADRIVLSAGSRPLIPDVPGLADVVNHTSDTVMRLEELPSSMLIVGGGFIAAEMGHVFSSFGTDVTVVQRGPRLLQSEDEQVSTTFTELAHQRMNLMLNSQVGSVAPDGSGVLATVEGPDGPQEVRADVLLWATGRQPNSDELDVAAAGIEVDEHGHVVTDVHGETAVPGVWAFGDLANHFQLKHMANAEARVLTHNLLHPDDLKPKPAGPAPHAVFANPQIASVGMTEAEARAEGERTGNAPLIGIREFQSTAYGWALEDHHSFVKVIADPETRLLLGAHILGPEASMLIQPLLQGLMLGNTVDQMARDVLYIHPALTEVVEQALLEL